MTSALDRLRTVCNSIESFVMQDLSANTSVMRGWIITLSEILRDMAAEEGTKGQFQEGVEFGNKVTRDAIHRLIATRFKLEDKDVTLEEMLVLASDAERNIEANSQRLSSDLAAANSRAEMWMKRVDDVAKLMDLANSEWAILNSSDDARVLMRLWAKMLAGKHEVANGVDEIPFDSDDFDDEEEREDDDFDDYDDYDDGPYEDDEDDFDPMDDPDFVGTVSGSGGK